jgi:hypothetical protein
MNNDFWFFKITNKNKYKKCGANGFENIPESNSYQHSVNRYYNHSNNMLQHFYY